MKIERSDLPLRLPLRCHEQEKVMIGWELISMNRVRGN